MDYCHGNFEILSQTPLRHLELAETYWKSILNVGDWVIDATCGNGKDTLKLAKIVLPLGGGVVGIDVQQTAIEQTQQRLLAQLSSIQIKNILLFRQCHSQFPLLVHQLNIKLIVYNLGYLPGNGNKFFTTQTNSTLISVANALNLIASGGSLTVTCYPGHPEGLKEQLALETYINQLSPKEWHIQHYKKSLTAPSLLIIKKTSPLIFKCEN